MSGVFATQGTVSLADGYLSKRYDGYRSVDVMYRLHTSKKYRQYWLRNVVLLIGEYGGQPWRGGMACDCKRDRLWVRFSIEGMEYFIVSLLWCLG